MAEADRPDPGSAGAELATTDALFDAATAAAA